jgi:hypothetical protein
MQEIEQKDCKYCQKELGLIPLDQGGGYESQLYYCQPCHKTFPIYKKRNIIKTIDFIGEIERKASNKVRRGEFRGKPFFELELKKQPGETRTTLIYAFTGLVQREEIWKDIEQNNFLSKKYIFTCANSRGNYQLIDWKEVIQANEIPKKGE